MKNLGSGLFPKFDFEDLRRELVSRKYSYKTIKGTVIGIQDLRMTLEKDLKNTIEALFFRPKTEARGD